MLNILKCDMQNFVLLEIDLWPRSSLVFLLDRNKVLVDLIVSFKSVDIQLFYDRIEEAKNFILETTKYEVTFIALL